MQVPHRKSQDFRKYGDAPDGYLTVEAIESLRAEIVRLETVSRPKTVIELTAAREMGDLSENAAYQMAKGRLAGIDGRLLTIRERLKSAIIIERGAGADGSVQIGSTVTVEVNGKERVFEITGSQETDPGAGRISYQSPVGSKLLSRKPGETALITGAGGNEIEYRILKVE